ncbi:MAG: phospholipase D family protein [Bacteriovoracaceae bacterium]|nr:phospholipase D family protein [Bacteriovoracaceae bacterium]
MMTISHFICLTALLLVSILQGANAADPNFILNKNIAPYPFYAAHKSGDKVSEQNKLQLLNSGIASLQKRIDLIKKAKKEIILEYFIYEQDTAGKVLLKQLQMRAAEGIKVRVLLDKSITVIEMDEYFAKFMKESGIEVAFHHRAIDPSSAQFRTHRKILAIDGKEAITGGRNIGDDYFDIDPVYNFLDRDVHIEGPIVKALWDSFDEFWEHKSVRKAEDPKPTHRLRMFRGNRRNQERYLNVRTTQHLRRLEEGREFSENMEGILEYTKKIEEVARPILDKTKIHVCPKVTYISDRPGGNLNTRLRSDYKVKWRITRKEIFDRLYKSAVEGNEVILVSPYFMLNRDWRDAINNLLDRNTKVKMYTNSLGSTDAFYVSANFYRIIFDIEKRGLIPYIHDSKYAGITDVVDPSIEKTRWGVHSKTHIYDEDSFYIGTYNIDNRSDFYNAEMGIFCDGNKELTAELKTNIERRLEQSYEIVGDMKAVDKNGAEADVYGNADEKAIKIMKAIKLPSWLFEFVM